MMLNPAWVEITIAGTLIRVCDKVADSLQCFRKGLLQSPFLFVDS